MSTPGKARGSCLCGAVRFEVRFPSKWCAHCHCTMCRKEHGAGYVTWAGFPVEQFEVTDGEAGLNWYQSSPQAQRGFCSRCGSSLLFRSERWPGEIHVAIGVLDDPIDRAPQAHVFHDTRVDWVVIDEALDTFNPS
jgi:hypothetical protein